MRPKGRPPVMLVALIALAAALGLIAWVARGLLAPAEQPPGPRDVDIEAVVPRPLLPAASSKPAPVEPTPEPTVEAEPAKPEPQADAPPQPKRRQSSNKSSSPAPPAPRVVKVSRDEF